MLTIETLYLSEWRNVRKWDTKHRTAAESRNPLQVQNKSLSSSSPISSRSSTCTWYCTMVVLRSLPETSLVGSRTSLLSCCIALAAAMAIISWFLRCRGGTSHYKVKIFLKIFWWLNPEVVLHYGKQSFLASKRLWWWKHSGACVSSPPTRASMWNPSRSTNFC